MKKSRMKYLALGVLLSAYCSLGFASTTVSFYTKDQHGSIAGLTDATGNLTASTLNQYNDYGVNQSNNSNNNGQISINDDPYQYSGEYTDNESGLQPLGNGYRYYDPSLMRFISPDSYPLLNLYTYGNGNPIMNVDPSGHIAAGLIMLGLGLLNMVIPGDDVGPAEIEILEGALEIGENEASEAENTVVGVGEKRAADSLTDEEPFPKAQKIYKLLRAREVGDNKIRSFMLIYDRGLNMKEEGELIEEKIVGAIQEAHICKEIGIGSGEVGVFQDGTIAIKTSDPGGEEGNLLIIGRQPEITDELFQSFKPILQGLNEDILENAMLKNTIENAGLKTTTDETISTESAESSSQTEADTETEEADTDTEEAEEPSASRPGKESLNSILQKYVSLL